MISRLLKIKKIKKKTNAKVKRKTQYLLSKITKLKIIKFLNCFVFNTLIKLSSIFQFSLIMLNNLLNVNKNFK